MAARCMRLGARMLGGLRLGVAKSAAALACLVVMQRGAGCWRRPMRERWPSNY